MRITSLFANRFWLKPQRRRTWSARRNMLSRRVEQLEPRLALAADTALAADAGVSRPPLMPTAEASLEATVFFADSLVGPQAVVLSKSQVVGNDDLAFSVSSVVSGSVEKWDASSGSWIDASPMPTSGNPQELLEVLRDRTIFEGDRLRWSAGGTPTGERTEAFGVVGWSEQAGSTPSIPAEVPTAVEDLAIATTGDDAFTLVWDRPTNGDATSYTATFSDGSQTSITITDATTVGYQPLSPVGSYTFTVTASNEVGTSDASQTSYATPIDQTITTTMVTPWSGAYQLVVSEVDTEAASLPTLQSFAKATYDGEWVMLAGRTNGLHNFTADGIKNFPPKYQNSDVWVVDPATQQVWSRSLTDASSGLSQTQIDSLSATNTLWQQDGDTLFVAGGYVYDSTTNNFTTYNALTALDLPSVVRWVKGEDATLGANAILQVAGDEATDGSYEGGFFQVTGGGLHQLEDRFFLVFGQNFEGPYIPGRNGVYTSQVRSFDITYDMAGGTLGYENVSVSPAGGDPSLFRRRDLNTFPILTPSAQGPVESVVALAGVFYNGNAVWTTPVEIAADGVPQTPDPVTNPDAFRQAMNQYHSAKVGLYSPSEGVMTEILLGGISANVFDTRVDGLVYDSQYGFTNQITAVIRDTAGLYSQEFLGSYPEVTDGDGSLLHFGASAEFFVADGIETLPGGIINLDALTDDTVLGYVFGGIASNKPNFGTTVASSLIFEVRFMAGSV